MLLDHYAIKLPQMTGYVRKFDANTRMSFKISDKQLEKVQSSMQKSWKIIENRISRRTCLWWYNGDMENLTDGDLEKSDGPNSNSDDDEDESNE